MAVTSTRRAAVLLGASICAVACATGRPVPRPPATQPPRVPLELLERVKAMRAEAKALLARQSELYWRNWVYGDAVDVAATYRGHQALFSPDAIGAVGRLLGLTDDPRERRALTLFRLYLIGEAVGRAVAPLSDQALTLEAEATFVTPAGIEQPYRELNQLLANEVSYGLRGQISEAAVSVVRKLNPILERKEAVASQALAGLGYPRPEQFAEALREVDPKRLSKLANDVLDGTQALYERSMNTAIHAELGIGLAGMRRADVPRFDRNPALDAWFPAAKLLPTLRATFAGLGIDVAKQANLRIDDAPLPKKDPRAVCFPIAVPGDVRLSVKPLGGVSDYESLFHEAGHAEQYAHVRDEPFELQLLGDGTVGEAFAFLFEGLIQNPRWLAEKVGLGGDRAAAFVRGAAVRKLYLLRRYAGKLLFDLAWSRGAADPRDLYRRTLSRAYGFPLSDADADRWLVDHDDFLASADYFRAWFLAAQIEAWLEKRFGPAWWDEKAAGDALIGLWQPGNAVGPEDLARELGDAGIRPEPLLALLRAALGS